MKKFKGFHNLEKTKGSKCDLFEKNFENIATFIVRIGSETRDTIKETLDLIFFFILILFDTIEILISQK